MRTVFTALAFLVILMAVIPAVRRSMLPTRREAESHSRESRPPQATIE